MLHTDFVRILVLAGLLVFVVLPACSLALTQPPQYMPYYVGVYSAARAYDTSWDVPSSEMIYNSGWQAETLGGTPTGGLSAASHTGSSAVGGVINLGEATGAASASASYRTDYSFARAISFCWLYWGDTLTVTSSTLPDWAPVTLQMTMTFDATTYVSSTILADAEATASFWVGNDVNSPDREETITYRRNTPPASNQATMTLNTYVGSQIWIHGETFIDANAAASSTNRDVSAYANMSNTALYNVDVLTPEAAYTTSSGVSYVTPVPEPSALIALTLGLSGLAPLVIRRRSV